MAIERTTPATQNAPSSAKTPSNRKGKSTESSSVSRGGTPNSAVDSKPPRQPARTGRLYEASRGDSRPPTVNPYSYDTAVLTIFPEYIEFDGEDVLQLAVKKEHRKSTE